MNAIVIARSRRSMTQKRLAHEAGIDARTLRKIEKGEQVSPESYRAVCVALGIEPARPEPDVSPDIKAVWYPSDVFSIAFIVLLIAGAIFWFYQFASEAPNYEVTMYGESDCMTVLGFPQVGVLEDWALATPGLSVTDVRTFPGKSLCATVMRVKSDLSELALGDSLAFNDVKAEVRRLPFLVPPSKFVSAP